MEEMLPLLEEHKDIIEGGVEGILDLFGFGGLLLLIAFVLYVLLMIFVYGELQKRWTRFLTDTEYETLKKERIRREDAEA